MLPLGVPSALARSTSFSLSSASASSSPTRLLILASSISTLRRIRGGCGQKKASERERSGGACQEGIYVERAPEGVT